MPELSLFVPIFREELEAMRARVVAWRNAGLSPEDADYVDDTPGGVISDVQDSVLLEIERLYDFLAVEVPAAAFVQSSYGEYLDDFGEMLDVPRKPAVEATGEVTFTGSDGTGIFTGTRVAVPTPDPDAEEVEFEVTEDGTIAGGSVVLPVQAVTAGSNGNVAAGAISLLTTPIAGITVDNAEATSGGTDVESDESYSARLLLEFPAAVGAGTADDYRRWSLAYPGVGSVTVEPLWDGPGTVRVTVTDADNRPVSTGIVDGLQDNLDPPQARSVLRGSHDLPTSPILVADNSEFTTSGKAMIEGEPIEYTGKASGVDEVQRITVDASGGTFLLTFDGQTTDPLPYNLSAAALESALEALSNIGINNVAVTGGPGASGGGTPYEVTFVGNLRRLNVPQMTADATALTGGASSATVTTLTAGAPDQLTGASGGTAVHGDGVAITQGGQGAGQAPIGAFVTVTTPALVDVDVSAVVIHEPGYSLDQQSSTRADIEARITEYVDALGPGDDVILKEVEAAIVTAAGVYDVQSTQINGVEQNFTIASLEVATMGTITLTE